MGLLNIILLTEPLVKDPCLLLELSLAVESINVTMTSRIKLLDTRRLN